MIKIAKKLILMVILSIFMISVISATAYATDVAFEKNVVEFKEKKVTSFKIKWDANEGKIGTKKTVTSTIKKGAKVKVVTSPKRAGYTFQGWYTKKTGGTKITKNTKPTKSVTFFAHWTKKSQTNINIDSKLLGNWQDYGSNIFDFDKNGKFKYFYLSFGAVISWTEGKYKTSNGKIYFTDIVYEPGQMYEKHYKDTVFEYKFSKDKEGEYLLIPVFLFNEPYTNTYLDISRGTKLRKL